MKIWQIMNYQLLLDHLTCGMIDERAHPSFPELSILNYSKDATWANKWDDVLCKCRGLIYNNLSGEIVARPFEKFFNYGQPGAAEFALTDMLTATDKADGSLGILYKNPLGNYEIATRGSFASEQAVMADNIYYQKYHGTWIPRSGVTYLFEIVYPENRIVLDYGDMSDLILIGIVDIQSGRSEDILADMSWPGPKVSSHRATLEEILKWEPRENAEGYVLWKSTTDERAKIKQEDYLLLHKLMTNTSEKHIWETLASGVDPMLRFADAPDEFHDWIKVVARDLRVQFDTIYEAVVERHAAIRMSLPEYFSRKQFAEAAFKQNDELLPLVFMLEDDKNVAKKIWQKIKPIGGNTMRRVENE